MPIRIDDVKRQRKERDRQFEPAIERAQGVLLGLDSADSAEVRNRPGFVWYRRPGSTSSAAQALNRKLLPVPGLPVILQRVPPTGSWEVVDVDANTLSQLDDYQGAYLDRHAREHEPGGNDPLYVYLRMITPLRTTPGTGVVVSVAPLVYDNAGVMTTFGGNNGLSLSSNVPGSGLARYVLVYLDPTTNTLTTANGDTAPNGGAVALSFPAVPAGAVPSAYVRLEYGQVTITESDIVDARLLLNHMTTAGGYLKATGETTGATSQSQQFDLGVNIADNNGVGFYDPTPAIKAYLYQNATDDRFYISAETPVQFDMYQDDVIQVTDSSTATVLEFNPATGVLSTDGLDSVGGSGIAVADDLLLAQGKDIALQGASGGPQSGTARDVLASIGHILDGGHPANPYPATRNADDAEFNNSNQAENNSIGTHAGGDFWEWSPGAPGNVGINTTTLNHLFVSKFAGDSATTRYLIGVITAPSTSETYGVGVFLANNGLYFPASFYFGIRLVDSNTGYYLRVRLNSASGTISIIASYDGGSGDTTLATVSNISPDFNTLSIRLDRYISTTVYHRSFISFAGPATGASARITANNTSIAAANLIPDQVWLEFNNSGGSLQQFNIDSVRRVA